MRRLRTVLLSLALGAATLTGCIITQAQVMAFFELTNPFTIGPPPETPFRREPVDLNTIPDYADNKDSLEGLSDVAMVGTFTNLTTGTNNTGGSLEVWITAGDTNLGSISEVTSSGSKLWGPKSIGPAPDAVTISWDESATLFDPAGKKILIDEILGDGMFTAYIITTGAAAQTFRVDDGAILLVISAGL